MKGESTPAKQAFDLYKDMGTERSCAKVASQLGKSTTIINRWCSRWSWVKRAQDWDDEVQRAADEARLKSVQEMVERHAALAKALQGKIAQRITSVSPSELNPTDLVRWFEASVKIERLSRGVPEQEKQIYRRNDDGFIEALESKVDDVWSDEDDGV